MPTKRHKHTWYPICNMDDIQTGTLEICGECGKEQGNANAEEIKQHNDALDAAIAEERKLKELF